MSVRDWPFLEGEGTGRFIDCRKRCRSLTPPNEYEALRIEALTRDVMEMTERVRRERGTDV
jgi:hypothetical protein